MKAISWATVFVAVLLGAAGCSLVSRGTPSSWVGSDASNALLIQFTRTNDALQGTMDTATCNLLANQSSRNMLRSPVRSTAAASL